MEGDGLLAELRTFLRYDPQTGLFTWRIKPARRIRAGSIAGCHTGSDRGYVTIRFTDSEGERHQFRAHRLAVWFETGILPPEVDHRDRDKANTALSNLREATTRQNRINVGLMRNNTSGKRGVTWCANRNKWQAQLWTGGRCVHLGRFNSYEAAVAARSAAELAYFDEACPS